MEETIKAASDLLLNSDSQMEEERKQKEEERKRKEKAKQESRWYVNLIINKEVTRKIITRDKIIQYVRKFLVGLHCLEVATPMMNIITGRATDRSFMTYDTDLIKLLVGGFQHVYAIRNQFRKKKIRLTHKSEFTICESYMSLNDYNDMMELTEKMLSGMVMELTGGYKVNYHSNGLDSDPIEIDFTPPFRRIDVIGELEKIANLNIPNDCSSDETNKYLREVCQKFEIKCPPSETTTRLLDKLVGHLLEETCVNPTFIIDHPEIMSPLAKYHRSKPGLSERFELFVNKLEVCNGCTVLNDPFEQRKRFAEQRKGRHSGDDEAMTLEEKLCTALEYALPPCGGWGMGIDRFAMLLTDSQNIKEVLLFPAMKP